jgi:hypothetical protein
MIEEYAMPQQETFFEEQVQGKLVVVLKSYDKAFAREAFEQMKPDALQFLGKALGMEESAADTTEDMESIWSEVEDGARESWNSFSYFVVSEKGTGLAIPLFVSSDWPSAEAYAKLIVGRTNPSQDSPLSKSGQDWLTEIPTQS